MPIGHNIDAFLGIGGAFQRSAFSYYNKESEK